jgi:homoserine dehydrogenase
MATTAQIKVLKFGSSVLRNETDLAAVMAEIYQHWSRGIQVLAVVSALGNTTDYLLKRAYYLCSKPAAHTLAALLATGETTASALLALAMENAGIPVKPLDTVQAGLLTIGNGLNAELIAVDTTRLRQELSMAVVIVPGFIGRDQTGNITLLGRGGSDFTALFLAHQLNACCVLVKDVDGLYTTDPAQGKTDCQRFAQVNWETAHRLGNGVVQAKAIRFAASKTFSFTIKSLGSSEGTVVGPGPDRLAHTVNNPLC